MNLVKKLFLVVLFTMISVFVVAQTGQVGSIKGTVTAPDGTVLPGVTITLKSESIVIEKMVTVSNAYGTYRFMSLPPGKFDLTFEMNGMNTSVRKGIIVNANVNITVDQSMQLKNIEEQIVVEGKAPTIDRVSVAKTATIDQNFIESIPAARDVYTYFNMTPGISGDSAHGAAVRDNSYSLDGIQTNDTAVGTAAGYFFSMDITEEVSVQSSGLSAEFGSVKGAVVNVLTKSGGNKFSGEINTYYNHESLKSDNTKGTPLEGRKSGAKYQFEPGFSIGGPVIKDKLWFFANASTYRSATYVAGFPYNKATSIAVKDNTFYPYLKLTYQPDQDNKYVVSFNYADRDLDNAGADRYNTEDTTTKYTQPIAMLSAQWTKNFNNKLIANFKFGLFLNNLKWLDKNHTTNVYDGYLVQYSGSKGWDDLNPRDRYQLNIDGTLFKENLMGSHEMKFGTQISYGKTKRIVNTYGPTDSKGFNLVWLQTWNGMPYYAEWFTGFDTRNGALNIGAFFNDTWNINKNLTLNLGVRYDYNGSIIPKTPLSSTYVSKGDFGYIGYPDYSWNMEIKKSYSVIKWNNISPRFGLVYDLFSDGKTLFKANFSHYLQDNYTSMAFNLNPVNWVGYGAYITPDMQIDTLDYIYIPAVNSVVGYKNYKLKTPYTNEVTVGIDRELWQDYSLSVSFTRRWDRNIIEDVDATQLDMDALMEKGELVWTNWTPVQVTDPYNGKTVTFWNRKQYIPAQLYIVNPPGAKRDYKGFEVVFNKRYSHGFQFNMSYAYANATGLIGNNFNESSNGTGFYNDPNTHENAEGRMPLERRHQFKLQALFRGPFGINLSGYFRFLSGIRYSRTINSRELGVALSTDFTINAESRGSYGLPDLKILDLRLEKEIRFSKALVLKVFTDVFNVFNSNTTTSVYAGSSSKTYTFQQVTGIMAPRVFRLGARVLFN